MTASVILTIAELVASATASQVYTSALAICTSLQLPVTSWQAGDPSRSVMHVLAAMFETRDSAAASYAQSAFLDSATGTWLTIVAKQVYNIDRETAEPAAGSVVLTNTGGGVYYWDASDLTFRSTITDKVYHSTSSGSLTTVGGTATVTFSADEEGTDPTLGVNELDELVTSLPGVVITSSTAAQGTDEESDEDLRQRCRDSLAALSPNGPWDAYRYVATSSDLTGNTETTRVYVDSDSTPGTVSVYCAGPTGAVSGGAATAVQTAFDTYCVPLTIVGNAYVANNVSQNVNVTVTLKSTIGVEETDAETAIADAITSMMSDYPIGGVGGYFYQDAIRSAIFSVYGQTDTVKIVFTTPTGDVALDIDEVIVAGTITVSVVFV
jgi:uncharacterized phage protein gp47/JayE